MKKIKPLGKKSYGSIGHLPSSRLGPGDHKMTEGQTRIATLKIRDKHDIVIVQEKLDGSNVGVAILPDAPIGIITPLTRSGYRAHDSNFMQHLMFDGWAKAYTERFISVLLPGERICGEWLVQAHGTRYALPHEPFVAFDIFDVNNKRLPYAQFKERVDGVFQIPYEISVGPAMEVADAIGHLGVFGKHGSIDPIEGAVWRVERKGQVDFLCKYVRNDKVDGQYLDSISGHFYMNAYVQKADTSPDKEKEMSDEQKDKQDK